MKLPAPGELFEGRYQVKSVLGEGGFAVVYAALDMTTSALVALKVLKGDRPASYEPKTRARFEREVRLLRQLRDPHTVRLLASGESAFGALYIVFEHISGRDLSEYLESVERLEPRSVVHILRQVLGALREAHNCGLIHRDLKPANIRIYESGGDPMTAKLLDFGIARATDDGHPAITKTGELIGTPRYMSPEQMTERPLTPASDIYSLGMVGLEMLVGRAALPGDQWGDQLERLRFGHVFSIPESQRIDTGLITIIERMAARKPEDRYASAAAVLQALAALDQPAADRPRATAPSGPEARADRRPLAALVVVVLIVVVAVLAFAGPGDDLQPTVPLPGKRSVNQMVRQKDVGAVPDAQVPDARMSDAQVPGVAGARSVGCLNSPPSTDGPWVLRGLDARIPVRLPTNYDHSMAHPLIVDYQRRFDEPSEALASLADAEQIALLQTQNHGLGRDEDYGNELAANLEAALELACVDPTRVYVVGRASRAPSACLFDGVRAIVETGKLPTVPAPCENPVPFLFVAARDSVLFPFHGGPSECVDMRKAPTGRPLFNPIPRISVREMEQSWKSRNRCTGPKRTVQLGPEECVTWQCETPFVVCTADGGARWSDQGPRLGAKCVDTTSDFPYADVIWAFFQSLED